MRKNIRSCRDICGSRIICGGVFHNVGQLAVAMAVVQTYEVGYYFPVLLIAGLLTGMLIGMISAEVLKRTKNLRLKE